MNSRQEHWNIGKCSYFFLALRTFIIFIKSMTNCRFSSSIGIAVIAFSNQTNLANITMPNSVTSIEGHAFYSCSGLTSITIPDSVTGIELNAFNGCTSLASVTFQGTIASENFNNIAFNGLGDLRDKFYETDAANGTQGMYTTTAPVGSNSE
jgi:hypothetical protein